MLIPNLIHTRFGQQEVTVFMMLKCKLQIALLQIANILWKIDGIIQKLCILHFAAWLFVQHTRLCCGYAESWSNWLSILPYRVPDPTGGAAGFNGERQNNSRGSGSVAPPLPGEDSAYCKTYHITLGWTSLLFTVCIAQIYNYVTVCV